MSRRLEDLEPETRLLCQRFLAECELSGLRVVVIHTLRTPEEQALIYAQGRTRPGAIVTNAKPGESWHNFGRAFDVAFRVGETGISWDGPWEAIGVIGERCGLKWGGRWRRPDRPHFEHTAGTTLAAERAKSGVKWE